MNTIAAVLKNWDLISKYLEKGLWFLKLLEVTPLEKHDELMRKIQAESETLKATGRPTWTD